LTVKFWQPQLFYRKKYGYFLQCTSGLFATGHLAP